jgi:hypothetical protein
VRKLRKDMLGMPVNKGVCEDVKERFIRNACKEGHVRKLRKDVLGIPVNRGM